jgi:peptide chain release factor 1
MSMDEALVQRLADLRDRHAELEAELADPGVVADGRRVAELATEHSALAAVLAVADELAAVREDLVGAGELAAAADGDDRVAWRAEADRLEARIGPLEARLRRLLVPGDPDDGRGVVLEVRAAAGGDEAGLFAGELVEMYRRYAQARGWRVEELSRSESDIGGVKEAVLEIAGDGVFGALKHESGVHRVQRVPVTESQGRIHTSTASVAVLPAAEEVDVDVRDEDLRIDVFRSSGPGGQSVNTTDSAVRITHEPTGLVVSCQDEKSQHRNREKALRILRSRLLDVERERAAGARADARRAQVGTGDRSERIRTYNFPQSRITDHRIGLTVHNVDEVLGGALDELVAALVDAERDARLEELAAGGTA